MKNLNVFSGENKNKKTEKKLDCNSHLQGIL